VSAAVGRDGRRFVERERCTRTATRPPPRTAEFVVRRRRVPAYPGTHQQCWRVRAFVNVHDGLGAAAHGFDKVASSGPTTIGNNNWLAPRVDVINHNYY
jgi:hypothetical protein